MGLSGGGDSSDSSLLVESDDSLLDPESIIESVVVVSRADRNAVPVVRPFTIDALNSCALRLWTQDSPSTISLVASSRTARFFCHASIDLYVVF